MYRGIYKLSCLGNFLTITPNTANSAMAKERTKTQGCLSLAKLPSY